MAERAGFEPAVPFWGTYDFQSYTFGRSVTSPYGIQKEIYLKTGA